MAASDEICEAVGRVYGGELVASWATSISWKLGGPQPLDRVRCYRAKDHWHYVGYGLSDLDEKSFPERALSRFGFELTFRLAADRDAPPMMPVHLLQSLARYVWDTGNHFAAGDYFPFNASWREHFGLPGVVFVEDPVVPPITTTYGRVTFLQVSGVPRLATRV